MRVSAVMTRDVVTVTMDDSLAWVKNVFDEKGFHHVIVTEGGTLVGVVSDRDLLRNISPFIGKLAEREVDTNTLSRKVHQIMTRKPVTVAPEVDLCDALATLVEHRVHCLPVVENGRCVGIVTQSDILRWAYGHLGCDLPGDQRPTLEPQQVLDRDGDRAEDQADAA